MGWYYLPDAGHGAGALVTIDASNTEWRHIALSRRVQVGETVHLFDGRGRVLECAAREVSKASIVVEVLATRLAEKLTRPALSLAVGLVPLDRLKQALYGVIAAGISSFIPLVCERTQAARKRLSKPGKLQPVLAKTAVAACKQSECPYLPEIAPPTTFEEALWNARRAGSGVLLASGALCALPLVEVLQESRGLKSAADLLLLVGPEGGFTEKEHELAASFGALFVKFAPYTYRTEFAAAAFVSALRAHIGW